MINLKFLSDLPVVSLNKLEGGWFGLGCCSGASETWADPILRERLDVGRARMGSKDEAKAVSLK